MGTVEIIAIEGLPIVKRARKPGDNLGVLISAGAKRNGHPIKNGDVVVVTHVVVSVAENRLVDLNKIVPSEFAKNLASRRARGPQFTVRDSLK